MGESWYIESSAGNTPVHSCSFVEFDVHGDYVNFEQHQCSLAQGGGTDDERSGISCDLLPWMKE
jgi:hypothetical protein